LVCGLKSSNILSAMFELPKHTKVEKPFILSEP